MGYVKMRTVLGLCLGGLMAGALPSVATAQDKKDDAKTGDPNRVICRKMDVTGSRLKKVRLCYTARQWDDMRQDTRQTVELRQQQHPIEVE